MIGTSFLTNWRAGLASACILAATACEDKSNPAPRHAPPITPSSLHSIPAMTNNPTLATILTNTNRGNVGTSFVDSLIKEINFPSLSKELINPQPSSSVVNMRVEIQNKATKSNPNKTRDEIYKKIIWHCLKRIGENDSANNINLVNNGDTSTINFTDVNSNCEDWLKAAIANNLRLNGLTNHTITTSQAMRTGASNLRNIDYYTGYLSQFIHIKNIGKLPESKVLLPSTPPDLGTLIKDRSSSIDNQIIYPPFTTEQLHGQPTTNTTGLLVVIPVDATGAKLLKLPDKYFRILELLLKKVGEHTASSSIEGRSRIISNKDGFYEFVIPPINNSHLNWLRNAIKQNLEGQITILEPKAAQQYYVSNGWLNDLNSKHKSN